MSTFEGAHDAQVLFLPSKNCLLQFIPGSCGSCPSTPRRGLPSTHTRGQDDVSSKKLLQISRVSSIGYIKSVSVKWIFHENTHVYNMIYIYIYVYLVVYIYIYSYAHLEAHINTYTYYSRVWHMYAYTIISILVFIL